MFETRKPVIIATKKEQIFAISHEPLEKKTDLTVLFFHGFGGNKVGKNALFVDMASRLAKQGIASLRFDFRGSGDSEGYFEEQTITSLLEDALTVFDFLKGVPVAIVGTSLGGLVASLLALERKVKTLVLWAPVFDGKQWLVNWEHMPKSLPHIMHKDRLVSIRFFEEFFAISEKNVARGVQNQSLLCFLAGKDETLDESHGERYKAAHSEGSFISLPEADHSFSSYQDRQILLEKTLEWLYSLAKE